MKKMVGIFLALTMALSMFAGFTVSATGAEPIVKNGDFEDAENTAWTIPEGVGSICAEAAYGASGNGLKMVGFNNSGISTQKVKLNPGKYMISAQLKITNAGHTDGEGKPVNSSANWQVYLNGTERAFTQSYWIGISGITEDWKTVVKEFTVTEENTEVQIQLRASNSNTYGETVFWDNIIITEIDMRELISIERATCTGGWTGKNGTLTFTSDGAMSVTGHANGSYAEAGGLALTPGTTYRLAFQWKTNSMNKTRPTVKVFSTYTVNEATSKTYFTMEAGESIKYTDYSSSLKNPVKAVLGGSLDEVTNTTSFKDYVVYFTVPNFSTASVYNTTTIWIGQSGYYNSGLEQADWATVEIDNVSLKEDYDEIIFFDVSGEQLTEIPQAGTVTARIHLGGAGTADAIVNRGVLAAAYADNTAKQLVDVKADTVASGKKLTELGLTVTETDQTYMPAANVIVPQTVEYTFDVATLEADDISVYLWESVSGMKPVEKATISVAAADAAE